MKPSWQQAVSGPAIHALVVGVGRYPSAGTGAAIEYLRNLRDLTSPQVSAAAIAAHLTSAPEVAPRVGSVDLLVSDGASVPSGFHEVRPPTRDNIQKAFSAWKTRGEQNADNTLLFYFCGHGYQKGELVVLPEDVGADENNPLDEAIDMSRTRAAMLRASVRTQLWLIDSCREAPREVIETLSAVGRPLMRVDAHSFFKGVDSTLLSATTDFRLAHGVPNGLSLFSDAFLTALKGAAARSETSGWVVRTGGLHHAINTLLRIDADAHGYEAQQCESLGGTGMRELVTFKTPPPLRLRVCCEPREYHTRVELYVHNDVHAQRRQPQDGAWETHLPEPGHYIVGATPAAGAPPDALKRKRLLDYPVAEETLQW